jgi:hypothetical protein
VTNKARRAASVSSLAQTFSKRLRELGENPETRPRVDLDDRFDGYPHRFTPMYWPRGAHVTTLCGRLWSIDKPNGATGSATRIEAAVA